MSSLYQKRKAAVSVDKGGAITIRNPLYVQRKTGYKKRRAMRKREELKFYDTSLVGSALVTNTDASGSEFDPASVLCISAPAQGDTEQSRDGNRITLKSAFVRGAINCPAQADQTAADTDTYVHIYLVQDKQTNGAQLNSEDVFTNPGANAATGAAVLRNLQYSTRFKVLDMCEIVFPPPTITYDGTNIEQSGQVKPFELSWKGTMPVQFKGGATTAGVAGVADNSIHVLAFCFNTGYAPTMNYNARVRFLD